jgi:hypothetical protein
MAPPSTIVYSNCKIPALSTDDLEILRLVPWLLAIQSRLVTAPAGTDQGVAPSWK